MSDCRDPVNLYGNYQAELTLSERNAWTKFCARRDVYRQAHIADALYHWAMRNAPDEATVRSATLASLAAAMEMNALCAAWVETELPKLRADAIKAEEPR